MDKNKDKLYPVSEIFTSPQGEGIYTGTTMTFIRLAGCTVGKPFPKAMYNHEFVDIPGQLRQVVGQPLLPIYTEKCTLYDGREFACDTDYRVKERLTARQILEHVSDDVDRVCITGGEPLMHDISILIQTLHNEGKKHIHIETSGTIKFNLHPVWITVSPKWKYLPTMIDRSDELKLLVDENFNPLQFLDIAKCKPVFLHPVNYEHNVNGENLKRCMDWQKKYPAFRIGIQLHKAVSHYTKEFVR